MDHQQARLKLIVALGYFYDCGKLISSNSFESEHIHIAAAAFPRDENQYLLTFKSIVYFTFLSLLYLISHKEERNPQYYLYADL